MSRGSVIPDLQKVLRDSISRYEYFSFHYEDGFFDESQLYSPIINQLYDTNYVEEYIAGTKEDVQSAFGFGLWHYT